ncbi:MAG: hypothetical protein ACKOCD_06535 [Nitrospiraceae bacterium]
MGRREGMGGGRSFSGGNFQPIQLLFLGMPGDRAAVIKKGALNLRIGLADTATIFDDQTPRTNVQMKLETVRSGLFLRMG